MQVQFRQKMFPFTFGNPKSHNKGGLLSEIQYKHLSKDICH